MDNTAREEALHAAKLHDIVAERYEEKADKLIKAYGEGVRPSWVSTDVTMAMARAGQYRATAKILREAAAYIEEDQGK